MDYFVVVGQSSLASAPPPAAAAKVVRCWLAPRRGPRGFRRARLSLLDGEWKVIGVPGVGVAAGGSALRQGECTKASFLLPSDAVVVVVAIVIVVATLLL